MKAENSKSESRGELLLPRWAVPLVWAAIVLAIQVLLPWAVAQIGARFGWAHQKPAWWNLSGLVVVAIGLGLYTWCLAFHFRSYRRAVRVSFSPPQLVTAGLYQISRNPMYVSGLFTWLGWTIYFGSPAVLVALVLLWCVFTLRVIPYEERQLASLFGDDYLAYKRSVRRWIGRY